MNDNIKYKFEFSLVVLNQLGRGMYRNLSTVIAEAVSNSWDADATEVRINIKPSDGSMIIRDNGKGMNKFDFQNKFLNVGYSKRNSKTSSARKVLGRKGIGKLALLTVSQKITIKSKMDNCEEVSAIIDNQKLNQAIKNYSQYELEESFDKSEFNNIKTGSYFKFENIIPKLNRIELIRKYLAILFNFNFSFVNEKFDIFVNDKLVGKKDLADLNKNTQFIWFIGLEIENIEKLNDRFFNTEETFAINEASSCKFKFKNRTFNIRGFIASVNKPSQIKIRGSGIDKDGNEFKAGVHLFSNGRSRQDDIFRDIPSERFVESYLFGEIHVDEFDDGADDIFTSSREGVSMESPEYDLFLKKMKSIFEKIIRKWDSKRKANRKKAVDVRLKEVLQENVSLIRDDRKKVIVDISRLIDDRKSQKFVNTLEDLYPILNKLKLGGTNDFKKILIVHSSKDKVKADMIYKILLGLGFSPMEILFSSSNNIQSDVPGGRNIFNYIKEFFIQDLLKNPFIIFIYSADFDKSWNAVLEAGATWVTGIDHCVFIMARKKPEPPINMDQHLFGKINEIGNFNTWKIFKNICDRFNKSNKTFEEFQDIVSKSKILITNSKK